MSGLFVFLDHHMPRTLAPTESASILESLLTSISQQDLDTLESEEASGSGFAQQSRLRTDRPPTTTPPPKG